MDLNTLPGSRIVQVARLAFARPDTDFLCFGESDWRSSPAAGSAAAAALAAGNTLYPDVRGLPLLRSGIADMLSALHRRPVDETRVVVTASGMAALSVALSSVVRAGDRVLLHEPAWPNVGNAARLRGATVEAITLGAREDGGFTLDLDSLAERLVGCRAFVLNSPNNPTGWTATEAEVETIIGLCRRLGVWLIADEVYSRLVYDECPAAPSLLDIADPTDRVIVCNSFSKTYAMTGWRLGWLVVPEGARDTIAEIVEVTHSGVAPFAQAGALAALADADFVEAFRAYCAAGRRLAVDALAGLNGIRLHAPDGAFYAFIRVDGLSDSVGLARLLVVDHGVAVAPGAAFGSGGEGYLRICFARAPETISRAMGRLRAGLAQA